ncbi:hypothetical protein [Acinetobacter sp. UBA3106]|uniref:hypothetical protein n=1 Tax=Acinetobacter sp. UBA3106 TaxID=1945936 RepID=UPI0025B7C7C2|nr:hypothetical protein [Acinetobacter sp. UBA3106]
MLSTALHSTAEPDSRNFMQHIRSRFQMPEHQHEFYIASALKTVNFDGTFASFERLDQLFAAFKKQIGTQAANFVEDPLKLNTVYLISSYIGQFISQKLGFDEKWQSFEELQAHFIKFRDRPNNFVHSYALNCNNQIILPLHYVAKHFCEDDLPLSISQEIEAVILNYQIIFADERGKFTEQMHDLHTMYFKAYPLFCGSAFQDLVQISDLDHSMASLDRLDDLMREIRLNYLVSIDHFLEDDAHFFFILFLAAYVGQVIAAQAGTSLRWFRPEQVSQMLGQQIPDALTTCRIAQINASIFFVTQHICQFLFEPVISESSTQYVLNALETIKATRNPIYLAEDTQKANSNLQQSPFYEALYQAGQLTHFLLLHIHGVVPRTSCEQSLTPTSYPPGNTFFSHIDGPDAPLRQLDINAEQYPYNVLGYEMYACLPHVRTDAISLHVRNYGEQHMNIHLVIPFFQVFDYRGFCILQPYFLSRDDITSKNLAEIYHAMGAFFKGLQDSERNRPAESQIWAQYYQPDKLPYPKAMQQNIPALVS